MSDAQLLAGISAKNPSLYRRIRVALGDPAAWIETSERSIALVRDLEMDRVRQHSAADQVVCPADFAPESGLDADRETATAQAAAEFCVRHGITRIAADRTLPYIFVWHLQQAGIDVSYNPQLGVLDRRQKTEQEIELLAEAQSVTESVMRMICEIIAGAQADSEGNLEHAGERLTSEGLRALAAQEFLRRDYSMSHGAIVATAPHVADCHHAGTGPLKSGVPVIVDLFPTNNQTRYCGDCTRTVVHGEPTDTVKHMHQAVVKAKKAAEAELRVGKTGDDVQRATEAALIAEGYETSRGNITDQPSIQHGTGHGIGLEVHEPILLDFGSGELLEREVFTVEPGLYGRQVGGVRVEDMLVVRQGEAQNLNQLHQGLDWK
jgi:Xaa-Pro aminopeptidase